MTFLTPGTRDAEKMLKVMDPEATKLKRSDPEAYKEAVELAGHMLMEAWGLYEEKAKFMVVGQLYLRDGKTVKQWDPSCDKIAIGPFSTVKQAQAAVFGTSYSNASPSDEFLAMVVPYFMGTPAAWHKQRAEEIEAAKPKDENDHGTQADRLIAQVHEQDAARPRCQLETLDDDLEFVQCIRDAGHPGHCFAQYPETWGLEVVDGIKRVREAVEERSAT